MTHHEKESLTTQMKMKSTERNVLVVDDHEFVRKAFEPELGFHGYKVDFASSGQEALEKVKATAYDLIFLDLVMPGMGGPQTCAAIKDIRPDAKLVGFTGVFDGELTEREVAFVHAGGQVHALYKPFGEGEILGVAQKVLAES